MDMIFLGHSYICDSDINECLEKNGGCDSKRKCINTPGSSKCGDCPAGWANEGATGCKGLCLAVSWYRFISLATHSLSDLLQTKQSTRLVWADVNECLKNNGGCDSKRKCVNSVGSFKCGDCPSGWVNDGALGCKGLCHLHLRNPS